MKSKSLVISLISVLCLSTLTGCNKKTDINNTTVTNNTVQESTTKTEEKVIEETSTGLDANTIESSDETTTTTENNTETMETNTGLFTQYENLQDMIDTYISEYKNSTPVISYDALDFGVEFNAGDNDAMQILNENEYCPSLYESADSIIYKPYVTKEDGNYTTNTGLYLGKLTIPVAEIKADLGLDDLTMSNISSDDVIIEGYNNAAFKGTEFFTLDYSVVSQSQVDKYIKNIEEMITLNTRCYDYIHLETLNDGTIINFDMHVYDLANDPVITDTTVFIPLKDKIAEEKVFIKVKVHYGEKVCAKILQQSDFQYKGLKYLKIQ